MKNVCGFLVIFSAFVRYGDAVCTFPTTLQNNNWTSSGFKAMEFFETNVTFTDDTNAMQTYTCHLSSGSSYVIQSPSDTTFSQTVNHYYCFDLAEISTVSFSYYLRTALDNSNVRRKTFPINIAVTDVAQVCDIPAVVAELYVLVQRDSPSSAAMDCVKPLLGNFQYTAESSTGIASCGTSPGDGYLGVCDLTNRTVVTYNLTACSTQLSYSSTGVLYCIADTSTTMGTTTTYYQILYNSAINPEFQFTCMALSYNETDSSLVHASEIHTTCRENQNATSVITGGNLIFFTANVPDPVAESEEGGISTGLLVGLIILALVVLAVIAALLFYFCYWKTRDPNAGKPIVENTKPRFEDPDKEDVLEDIEYDDTRSEPLTRDDIVFTAESPVFATTNGRVTSNGHVTNMANGHASGSGLSPDGGKDLGVGIPLTEYSKTNGTQDIHRTPVINREREAMVIFNGDEKVISGNDSRVVPAAEKPQSFRRFEPDTDRQGMDGPGGMVLTLLDEDGDGLGDLTNRELAYPSLPREKSNLLPPIETIDPEKESKFVTF